MFFGGPLTHSQGWPRKDGTFLSHCGDAFQDPQCLIWEIESSSSQYLEVIEVFWCEHVNYGCKGGTEARGTGMDVVRQRTGKSVLRKTARIHPLGSLWRVLIKTQRFNHFCFWPSGPPISTKISTAPKRWATNFRVPRLWSRGWRATAQDRGWPGCGTAGWWICRDLWCAMAAMGFGLSFDSILLRNLACTFHWGRGALTKLVSWLDLKESLNCLQVNCPVRVCMAWKVVSLKVTPYTLE